MSAKISRNSKSEFQDPIFGVLANLNGPGCLEGLDRQNPCHFRQPQGCLKESCLRHWVRPRCNRVSDWVSTKFSFF